MKVLHVDTGTEWRGGQQQALYLYAGLAELGVEGVMACPPGSELERRCRERGLTCEPLRTGGEWDVGAGLRLAGIARRRGCGLLHAHTSHAVTTCRWARVFRRNLRVVATRRVDFHIARGWLSRWKYGGKGLDRLVCISNGVRRVMTEDGIPESALTVIRSAVDLHRFDDAAAEGVPPVLKAFGDGAVVVGTVAAMVGHKDYPNLLRAAAEVTAHHPHVVFCALGDGPREERIHALASELGLGERFVFAGYQQDPGPWLHRFDIFVLASREEGLGTSILDAHSLGKPVVATRTGGIPDVVEDGVNGVLVPPESPEALAEALGRLVEDQRLRHRLGEGARETVKAFSVARMASEYKALYEDIEAAS